MGKKSKKHNKYDPDYLETSQDKPSLKLVLKVGGAPSTPDVNSDGIDEAGDKRTRKKRKIIEKSDSEDEFETSQKWSQPVDDEDDDDFKLRTPREKKSAVDGKSFLQLSLDYIHKILQSFLGKETNGPITRIAMGPLGQHCFNNGAHREIGEDTSQDLDHVTDLIAPGYSSVISKAMDFSTMRKKIDKGIYKSIAEYKSDYKLMMNNCMAYNHPETIYHKEAKRLLAVGYKHMSKERLNQMRRNFAFMANLSREEIGLDEEREIENNVENSFTEPANELNEKALPKKDAKVDIGRFEAIPDDMSPNQILQQVVSAAQSASNKLQVLAPNNKMGYLKKNTDGITTLKILNPDNTGIVSTREKVVDMGEHVGRLSSGSTSVSTIKEDKRNKITPVTYLNYGAFSSFAPVYDSSCANADKEYTDLLLSTYGDEMGIQYAKSLQHFVADSGEYAISMVDDLLNVLTNGEHSKTTSFVNQSNTSTLSNFLSSGTTPLPTTSDLPVELKTEMDEKLTKTSTLILNLHESQNTRLSQDHQRRINNCKPTGSEINLANQVTSELTQLIKQAAPEDVVGVKELRTAMGMSMELFDTDVLERDPLQENTVESDASSTFQNSITKLQDQNNVQTIQICAAQGTMQNSTSSSNVQIIQGNLQDGTIYLDANGQMIFTSNQPVGNNSTQLFVGGSLQNPSVLTHNNGSFLHGGGAQIVQGSNLSQPVNAVIQNNIFLQNQLQQQPLVTASSFQGNIPMELQAGNNNIIIHQPIFNSDSTFSPQLQNEQFFIQ